MPAHHVLPLHHLLSMMLRVAQTQLIRVAAEMGSLIW
jgi:hypothetical protein